MLRALPVRKSILYFVVLQRKYCNIMSNVPSEVFQKNHTVALWDRETCSWLPVWEYAALADTEAHSFWFSAQYLSLLINFLFIYTVGVWTSTTSSFYSGTAKILASLGSHSNCFQLSQFLMKMLFNLQNWTLNLIISSGHSCHRRYWYVGRVGKTNTPQFLPIHRHTNGKLSQTVPVNKGQTTS